MFCYVPASIATYSKTFWLFSLRPITVLMRQTRQAVRAINQSIFLRCLWNQLSAVHNNICGLYYKHVMTIIYDCSNSGLYYKCVMIVIYPSG